MVEFTHEAIWSWTFFVTSLICLWFSRSIYVITLLHLWKLGFRKVECLLWGGFRSTGPYLHILWGPGWVSTFRAPTNPVISTSRTIDRNAIWGKPLSWTCIGPYNFSLLHPKIHMRWLSRRKGVLGVILLGGIWRSQFQFGGVGTTHSWTTEIDRVSV